MVDTNIGDRGERVGRESEWDRERVWMGGWHIGRVWMRIRESERECE